MPNESRIAYSFTQPAFKREQMRPDLWRLLPHTHTWVLNLQPCWEALLPELTRLDLLMACAVTPSISLATALAPAALTPLPDGERWLCLESALEVDTRQLASVCLVIEGQGAHTFASLQFFDAAGQGALKLLATNGTDLQAFHELARRMGIEPDATLEPVPQAHSNPPSRELTAAEKAAVRAHWLSLSRTLPEDAFPGLEQVSRGMALRVAGAERAWQVSMKAARAAVSLAMLHGAPIGVAVRTGAAVLPAGFYPQRCSSRGCGTTYFADATQLTLKHPATSEGAVWVVRFARHHHEVCCLEFYDKMGRFSAGIGLRPEASPRHHRLWNSLLSIAQSVPGS